MDTDGINSAPAFSMSILPNNVPTMTASETGNSSSSNNQVQVGQGPVMDPNQMRQQMIELQQQLLRMQQMQQQFQPQGYMMNTWNGQAQVSFAKSPIDSAYFS